MTQQQGAGIRGDCSTVKSSDNFAPIKAFKFDLFRDTVCLHRTPS